MQSLLFAFSKLPTNYLKSSFYLKQLLFSLGNPLHVKSAWSICRLIGQTLISWGFQLSAWNFVSMAIKFQYFKRKLRCANMQNLFKIRIFIIHIQNCTLQLNFKAQFPVTKFQIFNTKSRIQATWRHLLPENFPKSPTLNIYFWTMLEYFQKLSMGECSPLPSASTGILSFQNSGTLFLGLNLVNFLGKLKSENRSNLEMRQRNIVMHPCELDLSTSNRSCFPWSLLQRKYFHRFY